MVQMQFLFPDKFGILPLGFIFEQSHVRSGIPLLTLYFRWVLFTL